MKHQAQPVSGVSGVKAITFSIFVTYTGLPCEYSIFIILQQYLSSMKEHYLCGGTLV